MTKKHFILIAGVLYRLKCNGEEIGQTAEMLAEEFKKINPNFDKERFLTACGLIEE